MAISSYIGSLLGSNCININTFFRFLSLSYQGMIDICCMWHVYALYIYFSFRRARFFLRGKATSADTIRCYLSLSFLLRRDYIFFSLLVSVCALYKRQCAHFSHLLFSTHNYLSKLRIHPQIAGDPYIMWKKIARTF